MCPLLLDPCSFKDNSINNIVCWKSPSQWTYIRQNQMYIVHNIIPKMEIHIAANYKYNWYNNSNNIIVWILHPYMNIHWVTSKIEYFCLFANWFAFPTNDHLIAKGLCNSIFCLYTEGKERIIVIVGIHDKGTICSTYGTILLSKMVSHLTLNYYGGAGKIDVHYTIMWYRS